MPAADEPRATSLRPADARYIDPVVEFYKKRVDRSLIRHMLSMTVEERLIRLQRRVRELAEQASVEAAQE